MLKHNLDGEKSEEKKNEAYLTLCDYFQSWMMLGSQTCQYFQNVYNLTCQMDCFQNLLDFFQMFIWKRARRKKKKKFGKGMQIQKKKERNL